MSQKEKKRTFDLSSGNNFNSISSNNLNKVFPGITLPQENKLLFNISQSIYTDQEYEELLHLGSKGQNVVESSTKTRYTISANIAKIKKVLASVRSDDEDIDDRVYYYQAYDFQKLGLYKLDDVPSFKVKLSHLPKDIIYELSTFDANTRRFVLKQAMARIFEDINFDLYHDSISNRLEVSLIE
jgi:hypothetical protein